MNYRTVQNDMIDLICWKHYGRTDIIIRVLDANPGLCELPAKLPAGIIIELPEIAPPEQPIINIFS